MPPRASAGRSTDAAQQSASTDEATRVIEGKVDYSVNRAIGSEIRRVRDHLGLTRGSVVALMSSEISVQTLANYEYGVRPCTVPRLVEICRALKVSTPHLVALALQRADVEPDNLNVDLNAVVEDQDEDEVHQLLRRWAENRLKHDSDGLGIARVSRAVAEEMATFLDVPRGKLLRYLRKFAPERTPSL